MSNADGHGVAAATVLGALALAAALVIRVVPLVRGMIVTVIVTMIIFAAIMRIRRSAMLSATGAACMACVRAMIRGCPILVLGGDRTRNDERAKAGQHKPTVHPVFGHSDYPFRSKHPGQRIRRPGLNSLLNGFGDSIFMDEIHDSA